MTGESTASKMAAEGRWNMEDDEEDEEDEYQQKRMSTRQILTLASPSPPQHKECSVKTKK
jgi:hypothetical protein